MMPEDLRLTEYGREGVLVFLTLLFQGGFPIMMESVPLCSMCMHMRQSLFYLPEYLNLFPHFTTN